MTEAKIYRQLVGVGLGLVAWLAVGTMGVEAKLGVLPATPGVEAKTAGRLVYRLAPGEKQADKVAIVNLDRTEAVVVVGVADAITAGQGEFKLKPVGGAMAGVGKFVTVVGETEYRLVPGQRREVPIMVRVPLEAEAGDYVGGVVVRNRETGEVASARVYVTVLGDLTTGLAAADLRVEEQAGKPTFLLNLKNTGDTRIESMGTTVVVSSGWGIGAARTQTLPVDKELLPGSSIQVEIPWKQGLPYLGRLTAEVAVNYGQDQSVSAGLVRFWHFEAGQVLGWLAVVLGGGVLLFFGLRLFIRGMGSFRRKKARERADRERDWQAGEPVMSRTGMVRQLEAGSDILFEMRKIMREELELHRHIQGVRQDRLGAILEELVMDGRMGLNPGKRIAGKKRPAKKTIGRKPKLGKKEAAGS